MGVRVRIQGSADGLAALAGEPLPRQLMRAGVRAAFRERQVREGEVSITILDDGEIAALNQQYLQHEGATDVISFPLYEPPEPVLGDIYIGAARAVAAAGERHIPVAEELLRLGVHGALHVLGLDHPEDGTRTRSAMWQLQERIVARVIGDEEGK